MEEFIEKSLLLYPFELNGQSNIYGAKCQPVADE